MKNITIIIGFLFFNAANAANAEELTFAQRLGRGMQATGKAMQQDSKPAPQPQIQQADSKSTVFCQAYVNGELVNVICQ